MALTGVVTNSSGARVPGAIITILDGTNSGRSSGTNSNGEYRIEGLTSANANVGATATFYTEQRAGVFINGTNTLNFTLTRATVSLSGNVQSTSGERLNNATVTVLDGPDKDKTATTNSSGDYRFDSLTAGDVNFKAVATGYLEGFRGVAVNGTNTANFTLTPRQVAPAVSITATLVIGGPGSTPQEWELEAVLAGSPTILHYEWNFGDGSGIAEGQRIERHLYGSRGTFTVRVIAVRATGGNLEAEKEITVE